MLNTIRFVLTLAGKDLSLFFADRRGAALSFVVPILLASAFGMIFAKPPEESKAVQLPLMVVVEDDGEFTNAVANDVLKSSRVQAERVSREEAVRRMADRQPGVTLVLPRGFEQLKSVSISQPTSKQHVEVLHHPLCANEAQWAEGIVAECVLHRLASEHLTPLIGSSALAMPFEIRTRESTGPQAGFNSYSHSFSGMTLQYLLFWGMESGLLLLRDRQRSVWLRLRAAPVSLWNVLLGKALATTLLAFLQVLVTFGFGYFVFGVTVSGSVAGFLGLAVAVSVLSAATGLMVAALGGTEMRARSVCILVILGVSLLGGLWLPSFVLPGWARNLSLALPTTWAMRGFDATTWQGRDFLAVLPSIAVVFGFTVVFLGLAFTQLFTSEARRRRGYT
jgi:ABC-2 type transport system permease protein